jgi:arsenate reductase
MRMLVLCTHNSARSQMAEGWLRKHASDVGLDLEVWSAGTVKTVVKTEARVVMAEANIDISGHASKSLYDLPDPWNFDLVLTVCDSANEACPAYPATTTRLHASFPDPSGQSIERWREVRDAIGSLCQLLVAAIRKGEPLEHAVSGQPSSSQ